MTARKRERRDHRELIDTRGRRAGYWHPWLPVVEGFVGDDLAVKVEAGKPQFGVTACRK